MLKLVIVAVCILSQEVVLGQDWETLRRRSEEILIKSINERIDHASKIGALYQARRLPLERFKDVIAQGLEDDDVQVRLTAAELLVKKSPDTFRSVIKASLQKLELNQPADIVRRAVIMMKLGDAKAKLEVDNWAKLEFRDILTNKWLCSMMCVSPRAEPGRCPVCAMNLVKGLRHPELPDWEAKLIAIRAVQETGSKVADQARSLVASDASAFVRLQAAGIWAKEKPEDALPHIKIFLNSGLQYLAMFQLAEHLPVKCVDVFEDTVRDPEADGMLRFEAYRGLLRAGRKQYLKDIRLLVDQPATTPEEESDKLLAIHLLGVLAVPEDIKRLEKLLNSNFKVVAAETIIQATTIAKKDSPKSK